MQDLVDRIFESMSRRAGMFGGGLTGFAFFIDPKMCPHEFSHWRRRHRTKRIDKKWRKRYGYVEKPCPGKCYSFSETFIMCPHIAAQLEKEVARDEPVAGELQGPVGAVGRRGRGQGGDPEARPAG